MSNGPKERVYGPEKPREPSHPSTGPSDLSIPPSQKEPSRKRPVSERKIQANRRNGLRSTGPKTERGKRTVARNAIKHGILAREVVITAGDGKESLKEFHDLVEKLWEQYEPVGVVEDSLVQTIATCLWKKARVLRAENGEIRKRIDTLAMDRTLRKSDKVNLHFALSDYNLFSATNQTDQRVSTGDRFVALQELQTVLRRDSTGLTWLRTLLETAKAEIASDGYISENVRKRIFNNFCFVDYPFANYCLNSGPPKDKPQDPASEKGVSRDVDEEDPYEQIRPKLVLASIELQLERISELELYATERENLAVDAEARSFSLPPVDATDKLLRYEAHGDRQFYRALDELERLQRQRGGETVPPPLNINLGTRR